MDRADELLRQMTIEEQAMQLSSVSPTANAMAAFLDDAVARAGWPPRNTVTDKGVQFWSKAGREEHPFRRWCARHGIRARYGAPAPSSLRRRASGP